MFHQPTNPIGGSLTASAVVAALPFLTIFFLLGVLKVRAYLAAACSVLVAIVVAVLGFSMPVGPALDSGVLGAAYGIFPIIWIVWNGIWLYNMTVATGHFAVLRDSMSSVSKDQRVQAVIIAFCFGALLEALAGFGAPVAITASMLVGIGFRPAKAAALGLVANTAPVAFGSIAIPITTLSTVTGLPASDLGTMVGRQVPIGALFVPLILIGIVDGWRGVRQIWPAGVLAGAVFALCQFATSNYVSVELTDIVASLVSAGSVVLLLRVWQPGTPLLRDVLARPVHSPALAGAGAGAPGVATVQSTRASVTAATAASAAGSGAGRLPGRSEAGEAPTRANPGPMDVALAYTPYIIIVVVFALAQVPAIKTLLAKGTTSFAWPGLHVVTTTGASVSSTTYVLNYLPAAGTMLLICGLLTMPFLRITPGRAIRIYGATLNQLKGATLTVALVLALAYVMNLSGQTASLGHWIAGAAGVLGLLSPIIGWLGVAVTGSDTASNSLFGGLQVTAAHATGLSPTLLAAANSSGGVLGKMISPQNLAIGAAAVGMANREGDLFRKVIGWSLVLLIVMCLVVYLQTTPALSWMVVSGH